MNITDNQLRHYVDDIFEKYDRDLSFTLDDKELYHFFKDLYASMGFKHNVTIEDVRYSIKHIDANSDGKVTKRELYNALKVILGGNKPATAKREENLPFEHAKQPKHQDPPKQPLKQQNNQEAHHRPTTPNQRPNQAY